MKKQQFFRRVRSFFGVVRDFFIEEEPRDRARRTMREATQALNRVIYQRLVLESELASGELDKETRMWCEKNLELLNQSERDMTGRLTGLREEYRTLMLQDLFYKTINDPSGESFEEAQQALMELQSSVEAERTIRSLPRYLPQPRTTVETVAITDSHDVPTPHKVNDANGTNGTPHHSLKEEKPLMNAHGR